MDHNEFGELEFEDQTIEAFLQMDGSNRLQAISNMDPKRVALFRAHFRAHNIVAYSEKLAAKVEAQPEHPNVERWKARLAECKESLKNLKEFGVERVPSAVPDGVNIEVPVDVFKAIDNPPGS